MGGKFAEALGIRCVDLGKLEGEYRRRHVSTDYALFLVALAVTTPPLAALARHDLHFLGNSPAAYLLIGARFAMLLWAIFLAWHVRKVEDPDRLDRWVLSWMIPIVVTQFCIDLSRPSDYLYSFVLDVPFILMLLLTTGCGWPKRAVPPTIHTLAVLYVVWYCKQPHAVTPQGSITWSLLLALTGGYIMAGRIENYRRSQFLSSIREAEARRELEKSLRELRETRAQVATLSGLLPICSNCKKVRDDHGYWQQIESYLSLHSEARFSHGLCPECLKSLYPEYYDRPQPFAGSRSTEAASKKP